MRPLAVSMGDPAGIGLELAARVHSEGGAPPFFLIGDPDALMRAAARARRSIQVRVIEHARDAEPGGALNVLAEALAIDEAPGAPDANNAGAITRAIARGVEACLTGDAAGIVTLPIAKATLYEAGFSYPGHTEYVGALTEQTPSADARGPVMMLAHDALKVALVTVHTPLSAVASAISAERISAVVRVVNEALKRDFALMRPRLALCGLNPHAGESGALGREEIEIINPAAAALRAAGIDITDAQPPDTMFHAEARARYDAAIAMYHDQGLIPLKTLDFWGGVNLTLGLPIVRTSPDHGAAFDIAGKGVARTESFRAALVMARDIAQRRGA